MSAMQGEERVLQSVAGIKAEDESMDNSMSCKDEYEATP